MGCEVQSIFSICIGSFNNFSSISILLAPILARGFFLSSFGPLVLNAKKWGLKFHQIKFIQGLNRERERTYSEKSMSGLKSSDWEKIAFQRRGSIDMEDQRSLGNCDQQR
jgi:hypothetical protein